MECPSCNTNNHGNRKSCSNCGVTLEKIVPAIHCPTCDGLARVSEDKAVEAPYCKNCGFSLREFIKNSKTFEPKIKMVRIDQLAQEKPKVVEETLPDVDSATSVVPTPSVSVTQVKATQETDWLENILETIANSPRIKWMIAAGVIIVILAIGLIEKSGRENSDGSQSSPSYVKQQRTDADNIRSFQKIHGVTAIPPVATQASISADAAGYYIGQWATVCGKVVDSNYARSSNGSPTFLNFDRPYPTHPFRVVIWIDRRSNFPANPENYYLNEYLCATGKIESYKRKPQIVVENQNQLTIYN